MTDAVEIKTETGFFVRLANGFVSIVVGLSAFFVIKSAFMIPLNLLLLTNLAPILEAIGVLFFLLSIYLAYQYTKKINSSGTRKSRNIKRAITIFAGVICAVFSTLILVFAK